MIIGVAEIIVAASCIASAATALVCGFIASRELQREREHRTHS